MLSTFGTPAIGGIIMAKTSKIEIRVTDEFKEKISKKAADAGLSVSQYITGMLENNEVIVLKEGEKIAAELMRIRMDYEKKGNINNFRNIICEVLLKLDKLLESFPQNKPSGNYDETPFVSESEDYADDIDEDQYDEWDEEGDLI